MHTPVSASYKDSRAWQSAMQLAADMYQLTTALPSSERLGLSAQIHHAATAIPTAIAAGSTNRQRLLAACTAAQASAAELETLLIITAQIYPDVLTSDALAELDEIRSLLAALAQRLEQTPRKSL